MKLKIFLLIFVGLSMNTQADYYVKIDDDSFNDYKTYSIEHQISQRVKTRIVKHLNSKSTKYTIGFIEKEGLHIGRRFIKILMMDASNKREIVELEFAICRLGACEFGIPFTVLEKMSSAKSIKINHGTKETRGKVYDLDEEFISKVKLFVHEPFNRLTKYKDLFKIKRKEVKI